MASDSLPSPLQAPDRVVRVTEKPAGIGFSDFLERIPPGSWVDVANLTARYEHRGPCIREDDIRVYCGDPHCLGDRNFESQFGTMSLEANASVFKNLSYRCRDCRSFTKAFSLWIRSDAKAGNASICKLGEHPSFGPPLTPRILKLLESDKDELRKGYDSERQGLGVGAFSYYRRVVENQKKRIIEQIIRVAKIVNAGNDVIADLEKARDESQFSKSIDEIKHGIPQTLLVDGHDPLMLLHDALSDGMHARTDAECLELASGIRIVLTDLADRIDQALKDDKELKGAIGRLLKRKASA
jgi:hypothetical protein